MEQTPAFPKGRNSPCVEHKMGGEGNHQGLSFQTDLFCTFIEMKTWHTKQKKKYLKSSHTTSFLYILSSLHYSRFTARELLQPAVKLLVQSLLCRLVEQQGTQPSFCLVFPAVEDTFVL